MRYIEEFRRGDLAQGLARAIAREVELDRHYHLMEFCGGHTHAIFRYGVQDLVPANLHFVHGPGCPVCVLPVGRLDQAIWLAEQPGVILCSYADMLRVPAGGRDSLLKAKARGAEIRLILQAGEVQARERHEQARAAHEQGRNRHAAHALRPSLRMGEPCPVCEQTVQALPSTPVLPALEEWATSVLDTVRGDLARRPTIWRYLSMEKIPAYLVEWETTDLSDVGAKGSITIDFSGYGLGTASGIKVRLETEHPQRGRKDMAVDLDDEYVVATVVKKILERLREMANVRRGVPAGQAVPEDESAGEGPDRGAHGR